ncbi:MAG: hypothetical protein ABI042_13375 [Verrucomicrobiota bacterium]
MKKTVHYIGLDVHKESIAVAIAPENTSEVRIYGIIGGTLAAVDKLGTVVMTGSFVECIRPLAGNRGKDRPLLRLTGC